MDTAPIDAQKQTGEGSPSTDNGNPNAGAKSDAPSDADAKPDVVTPLNTNTESNAQPEPEAEMKSQSDADEKKQGQSPYMQNRELSWLTFNERVLDQGSDASVPLLERLQFVSIFWSNLQEFFMVRVGSLTDLALLKKEVIDNKSNMTPIQQLDAIYARCHELYPVQEKIYQDLRLELDEAGLHRLTHNDLNDDQKSYLSDYLNANVLPFLSPQIINARHPFPHLENGALYIMVRLIEEEPKKKSEMNKEEREAAKEARKKAKNLGAEGVTLGIIPLPKQAQRLIKLPGKGFNFILLEDALMAAVDQVYSMYAVKHTNVICVTRNADLDATEGADEREDDYREHMKKILKKRARLAPVRLESRNKLSSTVSEFLLERLNLKPHQVFTTSVPLDMGFAFALPGMVDEETRTKLTSTPFTPAWPGCLQHGRRIMDQVQEKEVLLSYPYESMDPFVQLLREAAVDPSVVCIKITLYRLASQSHLAEALINAAESGKEVTALFELRARFDESNNIQWSQRFEEAGANVIYGFHDYKVHSKICCITRQTPDGLQYITQLGTGNYNEKTAKLYTDFSFITTDNAIGHDAVEFFRNMGLESASRNYKTLWVAPLQIKQNIMAGIDEQIRAAQAGEACGLFFKTNSVTDKEIIEKLSEASCAGVPTTLLVRGISCLIPGVPDYTQNIRIVSIVGRLLEHSRIYGFGPHEDMKLYLSSADLMTRNMDKRVEIAWPVHNPELHQEVMDHIDACLRDTAKLRELQSDSTYTALRAFAHDENGNPVEPFNAQECLIAEAAKRSEEAYEAELSEKTAFEKLSMQTSAARRAEVAHRSAASDLEATYREALKHEVPAADDEALAPFVKAAAKAFAQVEATLPLEDLSAKTAAEATAEATAEANIPVAAEAEPIAEATPAATEVKADETVAEAVAAMESAVKEAGPIAETKTAPVEKKTTDAPISEAKTDSAEEKQTSAPDTKPEAKSETKPEAKPETKPEAPAEKHGFFWRLFHKGK